MVPLTRRRALRGAAALLAGLSGCNETTGGFSSTATMSSDGRPENALTDPERVAVRTDSRDLVAWRDGEKTPEEGDGERRFPTYGFVASESDRESLRFADVDGAEAAKTFVDETDFETETIYYLQAEVRECYRRELCYVAWADDRIETRFAWRLRDAQAACDADARVLSAWFIRIPEALDPDEITRFSTGSSGGCRPPENGANESVERTPGTPTETASDEETATRTTDADGTTARTGADAGETAAETEETR